jgi:hypothetical protein
MNTSSAHVHLRTSCNEDVTKGGIVSRIPGRSARCTAELDAASTSHVPRDAYWLPLNNQGQVRGYFKKD